MGDRAISHARQCSNQSQCSKNYYVYVRSLNIYLLYRILELLLLSELWIAIARNFWWWDNESKWTRSILGILRYECMPIISSRFIRLWDHLMHRLSMNFLFNLLHHAWNIKGWNSHAENIYTHEIATVLKKILLDKFLHPMGNSQYRPQATTHGSTQNHVWKYRIARSRTRHEFRCIVSASLALFLTSAGRSGSYSERFYSPPDGALAPTRCVCLRCSEFQSVWRMVCAFAIQHTQCFAYLRFVQATMRLLFYPFHSKCMAHLTEETPSERCWSNRHRQSHVACWPSRINSGSRISVSDQQKLLNCSYISW